MTNTAATDKQIDYIFTLASKVAGYRVRYLSELKDIGLGLSMSTNQRGLSKAAASSIIDSLKATVAA